MHIIHAQLNIPSNILC